MTLVSDSDNLFIVSRAAGNLLLPVTSASVGSMLYCGSAALTMAMSSTSLTFLITFATMAWVYCLFFAFSALSSLALLEAIYSLDRITMGIRVKG